MLFVVQELKATKFALEGQLKEKQQGEAHPRMPKSKGAVGNS